jgi:2-C-methyl-D-erythritol 2,4-cyclodiphosphate synthase
MSDLRVGTGFDAHAFADGVPLVLGGVELPSGRGLAGHSDGDVVAHAILDAILGAAGLDDIGAMFPSGDSQWEGASSLDLLARACQRVRDLGFALVNVDVVLIGEEPRLAPHRLQMRAALAGALGVDESRLAVRATTTDGLGFTGRGEGLAAVAVCLVERERSPAAPR